MYQIQDIIWERNSFIQKKNEKVELNIDLFIWCTCVQGNWKKCTKTSKLHEKIM